MPINLENNHQITSSQDFVKLSCIAQWIFTFQSTKDVENDFAQVEIAFMALFGTVNIVFSSENNIKNYSLVEHTRSMTHLAAQFSFECIFDGLLL